MEVERRKYFDRAEEELNVNPFDGYCAPIRYDLDSSYVALFSLCRLVSSSFDRTWKVWEEDKLSEI